MNDRIQQKSMISEQTSKTCLFCKIIKKEIPSDIVYENDKIVAFLDIRQINPGHVLVVPKEHHIDLLETPDHVLSEMITKTKKLANAVMKGVKADGFCIGINTKPASGQVVMHTHLHIIPRFKGDGLRHWPGKELSKEEMQKIKKDIQAQLQ